MKQYKLMILFNAVLWLCPFIIMSQNIEHYDGRIFVDIEHKKVDVDFTISFNKLNDVDSLKLFIHQASQITNISSNSIPIAYTLSKDSYIGEDRALLIQVKEIVNGKLTIEYSHNLSSIQNKDFQFNKNWLELNIYTAWFPFNLDYGVFTYDLNLELPKGYKLIGSGKISNNGKNKVLAQDIPFIDIPIIISSDAKQESIINEKIELYYTVLDNKIKEIIKTRTQKYYAQLNKMLGESSSENLVLALNNINRSIAYARRGFISFSVSDTFDIKNEKTLAHEIAHLWWNKANVTDWEDWLNESFAEYSSIILQREFYGEANFDRNIKELKKKIKGLPTLDQLKEENKVNQETITYKGAYLLYELETKIGRKQFIELLRKVHKKRTKTTSGFLDIIGDELKTFVVKRL